VHVDAWRETVAPRPEIYFWRTAEGAEVDFVVERGRRLLPIEVKASSRVDAGDLKHLETFCGEHGEAPFGLLVYGGTEVYVASPRVVAVPFGRLL
jgi:predicted AAA+ superfamily ATPase